MRGKTCFLVSNAEGGCDIYMEDIEPRAASVGFPGDDHGTWNGIGVPSEVLKEVLIAPRGGTCAVGSGRALRSTKCSGHGIPFAVSSGSDGEARMSGGAASFLGALRRKLNILEAERNIP